MKTRFLFTALLLMATGVCSVLAQFGVPRDKKAGTTFQEINERAKEQFGKEENVGAGLGNLMGGAGGAGAGGADMASMLAQAMSDPEMMAAMQQMQAGLGDVMNEMAGMSTEDLKKVMKQGLEQLTTDDMLSALLGQSDEVMQTLAQTGMATEEQLAKWKADPEAMQGDIKEAFGQMKEIFNDGATLDAAADMLKAYSDMVQNPDQMMAVLKDVFKGVEMTSDEQIEEARLKLLEDPKEALGGPGMLAEMFQTGEMKELLNDPVRWREHVKEGQQFLLNKDEEADGIKDEL